MMQRIWIALAVAVVLPWFSLGMEPDAERGAKALLGRHFTPPTIPLRIYENVWRVWDANLKERPKDYDRAFRERYGFHEAPYPNNGYPMGLRLAGGLFGKGLSNDCMLCHGGSIAGRSYVGLGNTTLDFQTFSEDIGRAATGKDQKPPFTFCNVRGTVEAGAFAVFLLSMREPDLKPRAGRLDLELHDDLCEDTPAWWLLKKKKTMYYTGGGDARSVRSLMQFMLSPMNSAAKFTREEATFADIQAYILSLKPPAYPFPIDHSLANRGEAVFNRHCARCHGAYGEKWTYPNRIVPLAEIGTDPKRYQGISQKFGEYYNRSWFAQEHQGWFGAEYPARFSEGYQAPPLDGVWATAPYFHNGSAPTAYHVLNSQARPKIFTRSYRTAKEDYDARNLGWKIRVLEHGADQTLPANERRKIYDTTQPGRSNAGHRYGDSLTEEERAAVIEYLKTL